MQAIQSSFDYTLTVFVVLNSVSLAFELLFLRFFATKGVDLDRRIKWPEATRIKRLYLFFIVSVLGLIIYFYGIIPIIKIEQCPVGFFPNDAVTICTSCSYKLTSACMACID